MAPTVPEVLCQQLTTVRAQSSTKLHKVSWGSIPVVYSGTSTLQNLNFHLSHAGLVPCGGMTLPFGGGASALQGHDLQRQDFCPLGAWTPEAGLLSSLRVRLRKKIMHAQNFVCVHLIHAHGCHHTCRASHIVVSTGEPENQAGITLLSAYWTDMHDYCELCMYLSWVANWEAVCVCALQISSLAPFSGWPGNHIACTIPWVFVPRGGPEAVCACPSPCASSSQDTVLVRGQQGSFPFTAIPSFPHGGSCKGHTSLPFHR
jgi:hypothetical protein